MDSLSIGAFEANPTIYMMALLDVGDLQRRGEDG